jgi:hypothetical protein
MSIVPQILIISALSAAPKGHSCWESRDLKERQGSEGHSLNLTGCFKAIGVTGYQRITQPVT